MRICAECDIRDEEHRTSFYVHHNEYVNMRLPAHETTRYTHWKVTCRNQRVLLWSCTAEIWILRKWTIFILEFLTAAWIVHKRSSQSREEKKNSVHTNTMTSGNTWHLATGAPHTVLYKNNNKEEWSVTYPLNVLTSPLTSPPSPHILICECDPSIFMNDCLEYIAHV